MPTANATVIIVSAAQARQSGLNGMLASLAIGLELTVIASSHNRTEVAVHKQELLRALEDKDTAAGDDDSRQLLSELRVSWGRQCRFAGLEKFWIRIAA